MITPYFSPEEIENIINNPTDLSDYFKENKVKEKNSKNNIINEDSYGDEELYGDEESYEDESDEDESYENENDVENMTDKEKIKLAYEILSMTKYEDEFFMSILSKLRKMMRK